VIGSLVAATQLGPVLMVTLTDPVTGLPATISGGGGGPASSVSVSNFPASQAVTGTFWQATQPVSGPLTDTQLRATAVSVSAITPALTCTDRSGTITVGGTAQSLMAANPLRRGYRVQNVSSADLWLNDTGNPATAAPPSIKLVPNALYENPIWGVSSAAVSIFGAATGQAFAAMEG
jgi:hypothetical protein